MFFSEIEFLWFDYNKALTFFFRGSGDPSEMRLSPTFRRITLPTHLLRQRFSHLWTVCLISGNVYRKTTDNNFRNVISNRGPRTFNSLAQRDPTSHPAPPRSSYVTKFFIRILRRLRILSRRTSDKFGTYGRKYQSFFMYFTRSRR